MSGGKGQSDGARWTGTWLSGVRAAGAELGYPGERLGLPESGSGSVAGYGRRLIALFVDWGLSLLIASFLTRALELSAQQRSLTTLIIFGLQAAVFTAMTGITLGKRLCGVRVVRVDGKPVGAWWALVRTLLVLAVIPALIWDRDHRGMHDRAANTVVITL